MEEEQTLEYWQKRYKEEQAWGLLTSVDLHDCNPEIIRSAERIREYVDELCQKIGMRKFGETTIVHFGEEEEVAGFSMTQLIETSLISGHFANQTNRAFIDIFSCKCYPPQEVAESAKAFFGAKEYQIHITFRR